MDDFPTWRTKRSARALPSSVHRMVFSSRNTKLIGTRSGCCSVRWTTRLHTHTHTYTRVYTGEIRHCDLILDEFARTCARREHPPSCGPTSLSRRPLFPAVTIGQSDRSYFNSSRCPFSVRFSHPFLVGCFLTFSSLGPLRPLFSRRLGKERRISATGWARSRASILRICIRKRFIILVIPIRRCKYRLFLRANPLPYSLVLSCSHFPVPSAAGFSARSR